MRIRQFRYAVDNFGYLLYGRRLALAIDGGAVDAICAFVERRSLTLAWVANTHRHPDHTTGNRALLAKSGATHLDMATLRRTPELQLEDERVEILQTPGHTDDAVTFFTGEALVTGDTLFNGTVGNCFSGDLEAFFRSIKRLCAFPPATRIYAGHDYVTAAMAFARQVEPANPAVDAFLKRYDPAHVYSSLAEEMEVNPYLRFNADSVVAALQRRGLAVDSEYARWQSLMSLE